MAGPLSPLKPGVPFPATVVITPFETLRMRLLPESAMYRLPAESTATPSGIVQLGAGGRAVVAAEACRPVPRHQGQDTRCGVQSQDGVLIHEEEVACPIGRKFRVCQSQSRHVPLTWPPAPAQRGGSGVGSNQKPKRNEARRTAETRGILKTRQVPLKPTMTGSTHSSATNRYPTHGSVTIYFGLAGFTSIFLRT